MTPQKENKEIREDLFELEGTVEHFIFKGDDSGFCVAVFLEKGRHKKTDQITIVGSLAAVSAGETLRLTGNWKNDPRHGRQFEVKTYIPIMPATAGGIQKYLGSGLIRGIGPVYAKKIVDHFKEQTLDIIDQTPERLTEIGGIGKKRIEMIRTAWHEQRIVRNIMIFLQSHNISLNLSARIYKTYGADSIRVMNEDPFRLALDIHGVGFKTADRIAQSMGIAPDSPQRIRAGVLHILNEASAEDGHTFLFEDELVKIGMELLCVPVESILSAVEDLIRDDRIVKEFPETARPAFFPKAIHICESGIARMFLSLTSQKRKPLRPHCENDITDFEKKFGFTLAEKQRDAVREAMNGGILVITGGPGTGKTTIVRAIIHLLSMGHLRIRCAAPTGRAAKRIEETTGMEATTIHRLLKFQPKDGKFQYNEFNPLPLDLLIVDETSMVDVILGYHLMKAIPLGASLIFVGDADQLPSVGPGNFLQDLIQCGIIPVIRLNEIFRQARMSLIVVNSHRIIHGEFPVIPEPEKSRASDFFFIEKQEPEAALEAIVRLVKERIPARFHFNPVRDIQVITPMYRSLLGALNLNRTLQETLNPGTDCISRGGLSLRLGDKVMQVKNNYDKDVYNGDLGIVANFDREFETVRVRFDSRIVSYEPDELDELVLAYAITVHKSQGSEYPAVVIPVVTQHYIMLKRNLLYTAVTRGKRLVCLVGTKKALAIAVREAGTATRNTALCRWLIPKIEGTNTGELPF